ncbi:UDP-glycosyltransferase UGT5 isoform X2 [Anabrus simplex]
MRTMGVPQIISVVLLLLVITADDSQSAKILGLFPFPARSHLISITALMKELARRGHQVTVVSSFPSPPMANYTDIIVKDTFPEKDSINFFEFFDEGMFSWLKIVFFWHMGLSTCERALQVPDIQKLIHDQNLDFDVIIFENFISECFYGFVHKLKIPVINISPNSALLAMGNPVGNTYNPSYMPDSMLGYKDHMTFKERIANTLITLLTSVGRRIMYLPRQDALIRKYFEDSSFPGIAVLEPNASLYLLNTHISIGFPQPYTPNTIEVGGMHIKDPKPLPKDLQKIMDEAEHGVIYFSLGSNVRSSDMPKEMLQVFLDVFSKLKQRVLWKWEKDSLPGQPSNVQLGKWLPQSDILAHPNLRLFITHGGLLSTQEAIYRGVPLLAIPVMGEQKSNAERAKESGYALMLDWRNITSESLNSAVDELINNPRYRENVQHLSVLFRDRQQPPLERAVYWVEYVLRHNGAPHLRSAALDLYWYQFYLLDVLAVVLGVVLLGLTGSGLTCWTIYRVFFQKKKSNPVTKSKKMK